MDLSAELARRVALVEAGLARFVPEASVRPKITAATCSMSGAISSHSISHARRHAASRVVCSTSVRASHPG